MRGVLLTSEEMPAPAPCGRADIPAGVTGSLFDRGSSAGIYVDSLGIEKDMLAHINFIMGAPGTGKTTALKDIWDKLNPSHADSLSFYTTYSRSMAKAARGILGGDKAHVGTLHSVCTRLLGWSASKGGDKGDFLTDAHMIEFAQRYNIQKKSRVRPWEEEADGDQHDELGQILMAWGVARNQVPPANPNDWDSGTGRDLGLLLHHYSMFKLEKGGKKDYDDILEEVVRLEEEAGSQGPLPACDLLLIDEAQDLTPLMWRLVDLWAAKSRVVVIAGDDDQSIGGYRGVHVDDYLNRIRGRGSDSRLFILDRSYRLSQNILMHARRTIDGISSGRVKKDVSPRAEGGKVEYARSLRSLMESGGRKLILCASGTLMREVSDIVEKEFPDVVLMAVNPKHQGRLTWSERMIELTNIIAQFPNLTREQFSYLVAYLPASGILRRGVKASVKERRFFSDEHSHQTRLDQAGADMTQMLSAFQGNPDREQLIRQLDYPGKKKEMMLKWVGRTISRENFIQIDTYHASKGLESDAVGLVLDIGSRWIKQQTVDPDSVRRLLYVARTRAKSYHVEISLSLGQGRWLF